MDIDTVVVLEFRLDIIIGNIELRSYGLKQF